MNVGRHENPVAESSTVLLQRIGEICANVNTVQNAKELLERSLTQTMEIFGARRGSIFILDPLKKVLDLKAVRGMALQEQKQLVKRLGEGVVGQVAQQKKPLVVEDISQDSRFKDYKARGSYRSPSFICVPLLLKDQLIGVINVADKESGHRFNKEELGLLDFLGSQIALNYRRIQLYHKYMTVVKESRSLKSALGQSSEETSRLKKQIVVQEKFASIGKLAGGIAHEFNNPLDGVMRYTNLCLEHLPDNEVVRGYLLEIKHGLNRMANIVKNLLACSRNVSAGTQVVEVNHKIEQAIVGLQSELYQKSIDLEKKLVVGVPPLRDFGLELIVSNLLRNAIDAVAERGKIRITTRYSNGSLVLKMEDNGVGIPADQLESIFEPFFTTKDIEKGCGLGLTIVSEIVKSYNGQVLVESLPQKGTTFTIMIPVSTT